MTQHSILRGFARKTASRISLYVSARSLVASWLNFVAINPAPIGDMNQVIQWMQTYTPDENGDGKGHTEVSCN